MSLLADPEHSVPQKQMLLFVFGCFNHWFVVQYSQPYYYYYFTMQRARDKGLQSSMQILNWDSITVCFSIYLNISLSVPKKRNSEIETKGFKMFEETQSETIQRKNERSTNTASKKTTRNNYFFFCGEGRGRTSEATGRRRSRVTQNAQHRAMKESKHKQWEEGNKEGHFKHHASPVTVVDGWWWWRWRRDPRPLATSNNRRHYQLATAAGGGAALVRTRAPSMQCPPSHPC